MLVALFIVVYFSLMLFLGLPMIFSIALAALMFPVFFAGQTAVTAGGMVLALSNNLIANNTGITIILFILAGDIMSRGQITDKIFNVFAYFFGKKRGFMPLIAILTCMLYGAISGSAPATTAAVGAMCFPILVHLGYDPIFSAAIIVGAGTLGTIIPPSLQVTGVSALSGGLDLTVLYKLAAIMGIACGVLIMVYAYIYCLRHGNGDQAKINAWVDNLREMGLGRVVKESIWAIMTPVLILGTIFLGIADTAQSAALAVIYALCVSLFVYKTIKPSDILPTVKKSLRNASGMLCMVAFSAILSSTMNNLNVVGAVTNLVETFHVSSVIFIAVFLVLMVALGTVQATSITWLTTLMYPIVRALGLEPYTAMMGVLLSSTTGALTPPVGLCLFVMQPMAGCTVGQLGKKTIPCVIIYIIVSAVAMYFPQLFLGITAGAVIP